MSKLSHSEIAHWLQKHLPKSVLLYQDSTNVSHVCYNQGLATTVKHITETLPQRIKLHAFDCASPPEPLDHPAQQPSPSYIFPPITPTASASLQDPTIHGPVPPPYLGPALVSAATTIYVDLYDLNSVNGFLYWTFAAIGQRGCSKVCQQWIQYIEPKRKGRQPYGHGDRCRPDCWPPHVQYKPPSRLDSKQRWILMVHLLRHYVSKFDPLHWVYEPIPTTHRALIVQGIRLVRAEANRSNNPRFEITIDPKHMYESSGRGKNRISTLRALKDLGCQPPHTQTGDRAKSHLWHEMVLDFSTVKRRRKNSRRITAT